MKSGLSERIHNLLKDIPIEKQLDILRDCGFAGYIDKKESKEDTFDFLADDFLFILKEMINEIKEEYGDEIKQGSWEGIYSEIKEQLKKKDKLTINRTKENK